MHKITNIIFFFWPKFSLVPPPWYCDYISDKYEYESVSLVEYEVLCVNAHNDMDNLYINSIYTPFESSILVSMLVILTCRSIAVIGMEYYHTMAILPRLLYKFMHYASKFL